MQNAPSGARRGWGVWVTLPAGGDRLHRLTTPPHSCTDALTRPRVSKTLGVARVELGADGVQDHWTR